MWKVEIKILQRIVVKTMNMLLCLSLLYTLNVFIYLLMEYNCSHCKIYSRIC